MHDSLAGGRPLIGILGGMGPEAGLDLASKIIAETDAGLDQEHVPVVLFSMPEDVPNRTEFLLGNTDVNPAGEIVRQLACMEQLGVSVAAIACNTAHAAPIFDQIKRDLRKIDRLSKKSPSPIRLLHLIEEAVKWVSLRHSGIENVGILGTSGTYQLRLYDDRLLAEGLNPIRPDDHIGLGSLQEAIFDPVWGIKANSNPVSNRAVENVRKAIVHLAYKGADAVILGCTELPLAMADQRASGTAVIDPTRVMARALIRESYPHKLKSLDE